MKMKRILPVILVLGMLLAVLPVSASAAGGFEDVSDDAWYARAVEWAVAWGVTTGTSETTFSPEMTCNRGQVVTFLWRAHGEPEPESGWNPFTDVPHGSWYEKAAVWAVEQGITTGTSTDPMCFSPDKPCSYAEILTFIWRAKGCPAPDFASPLTEGRDGQYYKDAIDWAYCSAMLEDESEENFDPDRPCDRGRTVAWLWREATVYVSSAADLMAAIGPGREIFLAPGTYNLSDWVNGVAAAGGDTGNPYVKIEMVHDGYEVIILGVRNLSIETGGSLDTGAAEIVVEPRYANVLTFLDCDRVILSGLVLGHTPEQGYCTGGVLRFADCGYVALADLDLYGCGTYGVIAERCESIQTVDSVIRDCSYGMLSLVQVADAGFGGCEFRNCEGFDMIGLRDGCSAWFYYCTFTDNTWDEAWCRFLSMDDDCSAAFLECTFDRAAYFDLTGDAMEGKDVTIVDPTVLGAVG